MSPALARAWQNRCAPIALLLAAVPFTLIGGLSPVWALIGVVAALVWAALWGDAPAASADPARLAPASAPARAADAAPGGPEDSLSLAALDGLPDAAVLVGPDGQVVAGNAAAGTLGPVSLGRPLAQWVRAPEFLAAAERAATRRTQQRCHIRLFTPVERSLDVMATPLPNTADAASPPAVLLILRDLTEQEQLTRMRADFVANASHELRTPLATLRGFIETLQGAAKEDTAAHPRFLAIMQAQAERMSRLIDDLLSLSRIEMREHLRPTGVVDIAEVAGEVLTSLKPAADKAGISLRHDPMAGPLLVTGAADELSQVIQNLVQNAIKYGRPHGHVDVAIRREGGKLVLDVSDDGIGIAQEHLPRLTERFYRVSAKDSKERGGTGLGLAIVKHIVNRHRGELRISSVLGKGSTFSVVLAARDMEPRPDASIPDPTIDAR